MADAASSLSLCTLDDSKWREQIQRLAAALPRAFTDELLRVEAKEFLKKLLGFLPPKTKSAGTAAVARDIGRAIRVLDASKFRDQRIVKIIRSGNIEAIREICDTIPELAGLVVQLFDPILHTSARNSRGRVPESYKPVVVPQPDLVSAYTKRVKSYVGLLKAGYAPAAAELGASLPAWVRNQSGTDLGSIRVETTTGLSSVTIINRSGKYPDHQRLAREALASRTQSIRTKTLRVLAGKAVNLGFKP